MGETLAGKSNSTMMLVNGMTTFYPFILICFQEAWSYFCKVLSVFKRLPDSRKTLVGKTPLKSPFRTIYRPSPDYFRSRGTSYS